MHFEEMFNMLFFNKNLYYTMKNDKWYKISRFMIQNNHCLRFQEDSFMDIALL